MPPALRAFAMALITEAQRQQLLANGAARARGEAIDPQPVVKLHTLDAGAVWLLTELAADSDQAYGLMDAGLGTPELGHVRLSELEQMRGPRGLSVAPDPHFAARQPLSAYYRQALRDGSIRD
jgi:hypothetical protein